MALLLTVADIRTQAWDQVGDATDVTLQALLDGAEEEAFLRHGNAVLERETVRVRFPGRELVLSKPATAIQRVVQEGVEFGPTDFTLLQDRRTLVRTLTGPNPGSLWMGFVTVEYVPDGPLRLVRQVIVKLVKQDLAYSGFVREASGDVSRTRGDYAAEREAILRELPRRGFGFA